MSVGRLVGRSVGRSVLCCVYAMTVWKLKGRVSGADSFFYTLFVFLERQLLRLWPWISCAIIGLIWVSVGCLLVGDLTRFIIVIEWGIVCSLMLWCGLYGIYCVT